VDENLEMQPAVPPTTVADPPAQLSPPRRGRRVAVAGTLSALGIATAVLVGIGTSGGTTTGTATSGTTAQTAPTVTFGHWPGGYGGYRGPGSSLGSIGGATGSTSSPATTATEDQQIGVVDIDTVLGYANAAAAGTGMVLSADGEILTNNHVIAGATSISVTVVSTGATYTATVIGTDPTDDVAVLQLSDASGLQVADLSEQAAGIGDAVTAVGNAGGTGGIPSSVSGTITAVEQTITATDVSGSNAETLEGLLETDADVQAGDSGGPLYDTASGEIVGMDTAASSGGNVDGYAIPISDALAIAGQITGGVDNATVHQGFPAFLGVSVAASGAGGAAIGGVVSGGPAESAGLTAGDVITAVGGTDLGSSADLPSALSGYEPGDTVPVTWTDAAGAAHTSQITLAAGPAD
jgi:S1-C subfamily serine protease